jgi:hypothetical protein
MADKKPSLFEQAKKATPTQSPTERLDNQKRKQLLDVAAEEVRIQPNSKTLNRGLLTAMALDEAYKVYRQAIGALRKSMNEPLKPGQKGFIKDAERRYEALRTLKTMVEEDVLAEANKLHPSIGKLSADAEAILMEANR